MIAIYSFTLLISYMVFNPLEMAIQFLVFPILIVQMLFPKSQQALGPGFRKVGKSLVPKVLIRKLFECKVVTILLF